ncbi:hypothetical protein GOBAR_AA38482 [Gossypium barbadense]|uniref:Zinc finger PHD-type domain-containing protein n=1 Tax=Gossypium barbadense TaxID=3634 RepID=A0A2P5VTR6_GOSBA|nr:hypothetical protein GOBAR_AA38482 [Gossypium barbadense]
MELQHFSHPHPLVFFKCQTVASEEVDPEAALCLGCEKPVEGWSYGCNQCEFYLHKGCAELELAPKIQHPFHPKHPLTLLPNSDRYMSGICDLCGKKFGGFVYNCSDCSFDLHINCALLQSSIAANFPNSLHPHPLLFIQNHNNEIEPHCSGCQKPISGPIYHCSDCTYTIFNLHKECAELPLEINHPYDRKHPLTLLPQPPTHPQKCSCYLCRIQWKGYRCPASRCRYIAHVRCATDREIWGGTIMPEGYDERSEEVVDEPSNLITDVVEQIRIGELMVASEIKHSYHDYNLRLTFSGKTKDDDSECNGCMRRCDFSLDVGCATLPLTAWYKYDRHALTLTFSDDSEASQLYCDFCEKEREPNSWFYYCAECDNSLHLNCAIGDDPYMKLGNKLEDPGHKHSFTVVKNIWNCPPCKTPENHLNDIPLKFKKQRRHNMRDVWCCVEGCSRFGKNG